MKGILRLFMLACALFGGAVVLIRVLYGVSWRESLEIADQFIEDLLD